MKKVILSLATACLILGGLASCNKDKEGVYTPKRQIQSIGCSFKYYADGELLNNESEVIQSWTWEGKLLQSITHYNITTENGIPVVEKFNYDKKRLVSSEIAGMTFNYNYDGDLLQSITGNVEGSSVSYTFTHVDGHIASITLTENYSDGYMDKRMVELSPLRFVLDFQVGNDIEKAHRVLSKVAREKGKGTYTEVYNLEWKDGNVVRLSTNGVTAIYSFDNKINPTAGLMDIASFLEPMEGFLMFNSNNPTHLEISYDGELQTLDYIYTYDGDYPVTNTIVYEYETYDEYWDEELQRWVEGEPFMAREDVTYTYTYGK